VSWNAGAERVFEHLSEEVIGEDIDVIFTPEDRADSVAQHERQIAARDGHADDDRWLITKSGRRIYCSGVVTPINDPAFTGFAKIARDLTERKLREEANQLAFEREQLAREQESLSNQLKDDFIAVLSHELKHPLNLINVKAEMLPRLPEARGVRAIEEAAEAIRRSVRNQAQIIDDLLDLSRIRTGKMSLNVTQVDIAHLLSVIRDACEIDAQERGITFSVVGTDKPAMVQADSVRCDQIMWNVVSNALKFTGPGGKIDIALSTEGDMLRVDVTDTGQGIDALFLPHIFDMFRQQPGSRARAKGGLGIGLALVKQLVDMHGGRIAARSNGPGDGTCISIWFPRAEKNYLLGAPSKSHVLAMHGLRVLIVDDDLETGASFAALLELEGAISSVANSGPDALALLESNDYDVLISDLDMPGMDGYELIRQVRSGSKRGQIRAIAASGHTREEDKRRVMEAGFDVLVEKPVSFEALVAAVDG
jgi:two-component system CheB/CheR fusion protein